jgi:formylglycine-generating enzyme
MIKRHCKVVLILILISALSGCGGGSGGNAGNSGTTYTGVAFTMIDVPSQSYAIAQTEVTYELWNAVYIWAVSNGYSFANAGVRGANGLGSDQQPVTIVSWRDAIVWCNALTEYYNVKAGTSYKCVYYTDSTYITPLRTSTDSSTITDTTAGSQDDPYIYAANSGNTLAAKCTANGFRLPTSNEWYQAARYIDGTKSYPDNYASGTDAPYDATTAFNDIDGDGSYRVTSDVAVYNTDLTATVKSKSPNKLGLYDMSGNVSEWCYDWYLKSVVRGYLRQLRGGGNIFDADAQQISWRNDAELPNVANCVWGFRPVRTQ